MIKAYILNLKFVKEKINETKKHYEKILIETKNNYEKLLITHINNTEKPTELQNQIKNLNQEITQKDIIIEQLKYTNYEKNQTINKLKT